MLSLIVAYSLIATLQAAVEQCPDHYTVPSNICGHADANIPAAIRFCSDLTVNMIAIDGESYIMELANNGTANGSVQLTVLSSQVVHKLTEHTLQSSTMIVRAIIELTHQFGWSRITIIADIEDAYFLRIAEELYRTANLSSGSDLLQLGNSDSEIEQLLNKVDRLNMRIIVLSLRSSLVSKLLCRATERLLVWPEYAWIVHSVEVSEGRCRDNSTLDGVIMIGVTGSHHSNTQSNRGCTFNENTRPPQDVNVQYLDSCSINASQQGEIVIRQIGKQEGTRLKSIPYPSDLPPQYVATVYIALFYAGITACFIVCTTMLILYVRFRNEPAVKATSVSLSTMIFIGCYLLIFYLYTLNSLLLPPQRKELTNSLCIFRAALNGIGIPTALILSTLLVKLLRVHRLFRTKKRASKFTTSDSALTVYVLLLMSPNALIILAWCVSDPYTSDTSFSISNGLLYAPVRCISNHTVRWSFLLVVYTLTLNLLLIIFAVLTRKIKYRDFKDTKKISVLSFLLIFTITTTLFYWTLLRFIRGDVILIHTVLQIGHYCAILECQGFIFAPKLFPIIKEILVRKYYRALNIAAHKTGGP